MKTCGYCNKELVWYGGWEMWNLKDSRNINDFYCPKSPVIAEKKEGRQYWNIPMHLTKEEIVQQLLQQIDDL